MQLFYPSCMYIFYSWIKEDHRVLHLNLVNDGFYSHAALGDLRRWVSTSVTNNNTPYPVLLPAFASSPLVGDVPQMH